MRNQIIAAAFTAAIVAAPLAAQAQVVNGTVNGAKRGAAQGEDAAGPVGGIVGGALGAGVGAVTGAVGTATGVVGDVLGDARPRFREYVVREHRPSFRFPEALRPGVVLPREGVTYYDVPAEYAARPGYRYTVVNERPVIVDPVTRRIVEIIE